MLLTTGCSTIATAGALSLLDADAKSRDETSPDEHNCCVHYSTHDFRQ